MTDLKEESEVISFIEGAEVSEVIAVFEDVEVSKFSEVFCFFF